MTSKQASVILQHIRRLAGTSYLAQPPDAQLLERFTVERDQAAFATLVRRHGPMVLNVCRSVLHHEQDAEDAFQATFLVLVRKADSIRRPEAVAGWLYEVAYHIAVKAQAEAARRRAQERKVGPMASSDPTLDMTLRELRRVLHEELRRLPDKYRLPLMLCYLEGRTQDQAASQLGWSKGTFRGRLNRGREHLRRRLAARGVALSSLLCAAVVAPSAGAEALVDSVVRGTIQSAAEGAFASVLSARATALAEGVIRTMILSKIKVATASVLAVGLVLGGGALARQTLGAGKGQTEYQQTDRLAQKSEPTVVTEALNPQTAEDKDSVVYGGHVLGPDGKPVPGAKLHMTLAWGYPHHPAPSPEYAVTGPDGRFKFTVPRAKFGHQSTVVAAAAANHGVGWIKVPPEGKRDDLTLRLVDDDVPITGQIVDLEGKPVPEATLTVLQINAAPGEDLGPWLEAVKGKKGLRFQLEHQYLPEYTIAVPLQVKTDAEGRFRLAGIGRNRLVAAQLDGPTITSQHLHMLTHSGEMMTVMEYRVVGEDS